MNKIIIIHAILLFRICTVIQTFSIFRCGVTPMSHAPSLVWTVFFFIHFSKQIGLRIYSEDVLETTKWTCNQISRLPNISMTKTYLAKTSVDGFWNVLSFIVLFGVSNVRQFIRPYYQTFFIVIVNSSSIVLNIFCPTFRHEMYIDGFQYPWHVEVILYRHQVFCFVFLSICVHFVSKGDESKGEIPFLVMVSGDALLEPFWPEGLGIARGFLSAFDTVFIFQSFWWEKCFHLKNDVFFK